MFFVVCLILKKILNPFIAYNEVWPTINVKIIPLVPVQFQSETNALEYSLDDFELSSDWFHRIS
jgi:hypothetical protein